MTDNWWRGAIIYQIYPRSFLDSNGDGIGDLAGITARLDHVAELGVDAIWISPFFRSPMKDFGYDVADYRDVDPMFGTLEDFDALVERAHALGLKVIIDQVLSHSSDQHPWFRESRSSRDNPRADWYVWADPKPDGSPPNNWLAAFGGVAWTWNPIRQQYYLHNFLPEQPDLNVRNPDVQDALLDALAFWLDRGVDGFRFDVANFYMHHPDLPDNPARAPGAYPDDAHALANPDRMQVPRFNRSQPENLAFVARIRDLLDAYPGRFSLAEIGDDDNIARSAEYVAGSDLFHTAYSFELLGRRGSPSFLKDCQDRFFALAPDGWPCWSFSNHDVTRVVSRWGPGDAEGRRQFAKLMIAVLTCLRGTACIYQGEELGLTEADLPAEALQDPPARAFYPVYKGRDGCRTPMPWQADRPHAGFTTGVPWLPVPEEHQSLAVAEQASDAGSVLGFARHFIKWRRKQPALVAGEIRFHRADDTVLAFERIGDGQRLFVAFNFSPSPVTVEPPPGADLAVLAGSGFDAEVQEKSIALPAYGGILADVREGGN